METIGERIKNARKNLGYTQESLANMLYFSDKTISSWEKNRTKPDIASLCLLSEKLNTSIDYLLYGNKKVINQELEIKIKVNYDEYLRILNDVKNNAKEIDKLKQVDEYFKTNNNMWLRIRESKNSIILSLKKLINENKFSKDIVTIDNKESMKNILTDLNYKSIGIISKTRMIFSYQDDYEISFDDVQDLGLFIEVKAKNQDITYDDIINVCKHFSMNTKNIESEKYIELKSHL